MSEMLVKLWDNGLLQMGVWETIYMTLLSTGFKYCAAWLRSLHMKERLVFFRLMSLNRKTF